MDDEEVEWLEILEFCEKHKGRLSRSFVAKLARQGAIPAVRLGGKWLIRSDAIEVVAAQQAAK